MNILSEMIEKRQITDAESGSGNKRNASDGIHSPRAGIEPVTNTYSHGRTVSTSTEKWSTVRDVTDIWIVRQLLWNLQKKKNELFCKRRKVVRSILSIYRSDISNR